MVLDFVSTISEAGEQGGPGFVAGSFVYLLAAPLLFIIGTSSTDILLLRIRYMCIGVKMTIVKGLIATLVATIILIGYSYYFVHTFIFLFEMETLELFDFTSGAA